ncbi:MAG: DNA methyltransferase [Methanotrichaceae archaeon]
MSMEDGSTATSKRGITEELLVKPLIISLDSIQEDTSIEKALLNLENKNRSNLLPWKGQFSPQLIELLINRYGKTGFYILDPFVGSGTVLIEAAKKNLKVFGCEINPAAYILSSVYMFVNYPLAQRKNTINKIESQLSKNIFDNPSFFYTGAEEKKSKELQEELIKLHSLNKEKLARILIQALIILLDYYKNDTTIKKINSAWERIKEIVLSLPVSENLIRVANVDARKIPLDSNEIDLVITSPPYINVINYHQQYRASVESIGFNPLFVARSEIGSNRKNRGNRFLTVTQYILDMYDCFNELKRVCKVNSRVIFVVGRESNVKKTKFSNSEIIASIAKLAGMEILYRQERVFTNRYGQSIYEDILHFNNTKKTIIGDDSIIRCLAKQVLIEALNRAPDESVNDLKYAIESVDNVEKSPLYSTEKIADKGEMYE